MRKGILPSKSIGWTIFFFISILPLAFFLFVLFTLIKETPQVFNLGFIYRCKQLNGKSPCLKSFSSLKAACFTQTQNKNGDATWYHHTCTDKELATIMENPRKEAFLHSKTYTDMDWSCDLSWRDNILKTKPRLYMD